MIYHISLDLGKDIRNFEVGEKIPVLKNLENSLSLLFKNETELINYFGKSRFIMVKVYEIEEKNIAPENLLSPTELYEKDLSPNAIFINEHWIINQSIKPINSYFIVMDTDSYSTKLEEDIPFNKNKEFNNSEEYLNSIRSILEIIRLDKYTKVSLEETAFTDEFTIDIPKKDKFIKAEEDYLYESNDLLNSLYAESFSKLYSSTDKSKIIIKLNEKKIVPISYIRKELLGHLLL